MTELPCLWGGLVLAAPVRPFGYAPLNRRSSRKPPIARVATRSPLQSRTVARRIRLCAPERGNASAAHMIFWHFSPTTSRLLCFRIRSSFLWFPHYTFKYRYFNSYFITKRLKFWVFRVQFFFKLKFFFTIYFEWWFGNLVRWLFRDCAPNWSKKWENVKRQKKVG